VPKQGWLDAAFGVSYQYDVLIIRAHCRDGPVELIGLSVPPEFAVIAYEGYSGELFVM